MVYTAEIITLIYPSSSILDMLLLKLIMESAN